jgi:two-component system response regulator DegU
MPFAEKFGSKLFQILYIRIIRAYYKKNRGKDGMKKVEVLIVNQANLICNLLSIVLHQEKDIKVVGAVLAADEAIELADKCDIMLVVADLPHDGALTLAINVGRKLPDTHVLITGVEKTPKTILKYIEAGASGYVLKEFSVEELVEQIRALPEGRAYADPEMVAELIERLSELADKCADLAHLQKGLDTLSPRENEVLELLSTGKSNADIGEAMHIEVGTVKNHVHSILKKLGVANRQQAAQLHEQQEA